MSASASTSPRKWETRMTVRPPAARPRTISWNRWTSVAESAAVGSSNTISSASRASARRISTCCCFASGSDPTTASAGTSRPASATRRSNRSSSRAPLHEAEPARLVAQEHVLGDGPLGDDRHLLGDERDAPLAAPRAATGTRPARRGATSCALIGREDARPRSCRAWTCRPRSRRRRRERSRRGSRSRRRRAPWCRRTTCRPRGCRGGRRPGP